MQDWNLHSCVPALALALEIFPKVCSSCVSAGAHLLICSDQRVMCSSGRGRCGRVYRMTQISRLRIWQLLFDPSKAVY